MNVTQEMYKPTKDNIVVLVPELKKTTESGIHIPDTVLAQRAKEKGVNQFCEVVAVGPECKEVKIGSFVLASRVIELPVESGNPEFKVATAREYDVVGYYE